MKKINTKQADSCESEGVLLVNLGTPDAPSYLAVQRYLREFLSDRRVIEIPRLIWTIILYGLILPLRPLKVAKKYAEVWMQKGSPLLVHSEAIKASVQANLNSNVSVELAMRYGNPSVESAMQRLKQKNIRKLTVLPLYPQYSATTTASTFDAVSHALQSWRYLPKLKFINDYCDFPGYIKTIAASIERHWQQQRGEKLLISFHGLPKRNTALGDPYQLQCQTTANLIANQLQLKEHQWQLVFQSRFGKAEWLQPYCSDILQQLAKQGVKTIDVICPGFPADCLETLEEISQTYAQEFREAGGEALYYIPALNCNPAHAAFLTQLIQDPQ